jgi:hypothetical protein
LPYGKFSQVHVLEPFVRGENFFCSKMRVAMAMRRWQSFHFSRKPRGYYDKPATKKAIYGKLSQVYKDSSANRAESGTCRVWRRQ